MSETFALDSDTATVPELLARAVAEFGDRDYIVTADDRCTFREAEVRSRELARRMVDVGIGKGSRVALLLPSGVEFVIAWLAAARIGAIAMLFSTTSREPELRTVLKIGDAQLLISILDMVGRDATALVEGAVPEVASATKDRIFASTAPYLRGVWLLKGETDKAWVSNVGPGSRDDPAVCPDHLVDELGSLVRPADVLVVVYTSGSSAAPKAVMHTHGVATRKTSPGVRLWPDLLAPNSYFCAMPLFWIGGLQMILSALHHGGTVVCQPKFDPAEAAYLIRREHCTEVSGWIAGQIPGIEDITVMSPAQRWNIVSRSQNGDPRHVGMTETFGPHFDPAFFEYKIIDPDTGQEVAAGEVGEFCVRGPGVMLGMYGVERTKTFDADGYYHTGDRGYLEDHHFFFTGRYASTIKSAGANVSPEEVEYALLSLPEVSLAAVFGIPDAERGELIAAVVGLAPSDDSPDEAELKALLRQRMSSYKVPHVIVSIPPASIPLLASGKVDKAQLRSATADAFAKKVG